MTLLYLALYYLIRFMEYAILARVIISWLPIPRENPIISLIYSITEPILGPIRNLINRTSSGSFGGMMFDFSPIVAFILLDIIASVISRLA